MCLLGHTLAFQYMQFKNCSRTTKIELCRTYNLKAQRVCGCGQSIFKYVDIIATFNKFHLFLMVEPDI